MKKSELNIIEKHLKRTNSVWWNILARYTDGTIDILHGSNDRQYIKTLKVS